MKLHPVVKATKSPLDYALHVLCDSWSFLIQQEAFFGVRRFGEFQRNLSIAKNTLTDRLNMLVNYGLLERRKSSDRSDLLEYRLTKHGLATYPYALTLMKWGDDWLDGDAPVVLKHKSCGNILHPKSICSCCRRELHAEDIRIDLSDIAKTAHDAVAAVRVSSRPELYTSGRPTSVSRTLALIGDRWGFLILWVALAGVTKFEHFHSVLGVARTTLTARLNHLVASGLIERVEYQLRPPRYEYRLTNRGKAVCPVLLTLIEWGRQSNPKSSAARPLHLSCAEPLQVEVVCGCCGKPPAPQDVEVTQAGKPPFASPKSEKQSGSGSAKRKRP